MEELQFYFEILKAISLGVLTFGSIMYLRDLANRKKQRKLSAFEFALYILIGAAILVLAVYFIILTFYKAFVELQSKEVNDIIFKLLLVCYVERVFLK